MKAMLFIFITLLLIAAGVILWKILPGLQLSPQKKISNFEACAAAGNPVMESFPRQCRQDGQIYTEALPAPNKDLLHVTVPNEDLVSPLTVTGEARGSWYFEGSFPVLLLDANGKELSHTTAKAQGDSQTDNFVPFTATLIFAAPTGSQGSIVFKKDNPSGLPANDNRLSLSVTFGSLPKK